MSPYAITQCDVKSSVRSICIEVLGQDQFLKKFLIWFLRFSNVARKVSYISVLFLTCRIKFLTNWFLIKKRVFCQEKYEIVRSIQNDVIKMKFGQKRLTSPPPPTRTPPTDLFCPNPKKTSTQGQPLKSEPET